MKKIFFYLPIVLFSACQLSSNQYDANNGDHATETEPAIFTFFEEVNVVKMHLFGTNLAAPSPEDYPYTGNAIAGESINQLGEGLRPNGQGGAFACYHTENSDHYILRVPGKDTSSDIVLAKWDRSSGKLVKVIDLASIQCLEGICEQQDAWLADLDDSRTLELIIRKHTRDAQGNISNESFEVLTDDGSGHFIKTDEQLASLAVKDNYVMQ